MKSWTASLIGTRCSLHTPMAVKVAARGLPLFLEKPVATSEEQVAALAEAFKDYSSEVVVSFPLRLTSLALTTKEIIDSGPHRAGRARPGMEQRALWLVLLRRLGTATSDETGGICTFRRPHTTSTTSRSCSIPAPSPSARCTTQRIYGGDKPEELMCDDCAEQETCIESPFNLFYRRHESPSNSSPAAVTACSRRDDSRTRTAETPSSSSRAASRPATRRTSSLAGRPALAALVSSATRAPLSSTGTRAKSSYSSTTAPRSDTIRFDGGGSHFGGDSELCYDFLQVVRGRGTFAQSLSKPASSAPPRAWPPARARRRASFQDVTW